MEAFEILVSESQERMLAVVGPDRLEGVRAICEKWGLQTAVIGRVTKGGRLTVRRRGMAIADVPAHSLAEEGPVYERRMSPPPTLVDVVDDDPTFATVTAGPEEAFLTVLGSPDIASKRWVYEQYDQLVGGQTVVRPGADAAVIRVEGTLKALALSTDGKGRYATLDPYLGGAHSVAEAARNVAVMGAKPLAITNCLNFGNPERAEVMWSFAETVRGMSDACSALGTPVTGGNVSFYNESGSSAIYPTPVVGTLGLIEDYRLLVRPGLRASGLAIYLLGETYPELGGSEFAEAVLGVLAGRPPGLDLEREASLHALLYEAARADLLSSAHDCSDGGLAVALAESAIAGDTGFAISLPGDLPWHVALFSESASRVVVSVTPERAEELEALARVHQVPFARLGETGGPRMVFDTLFEMRVEDARALYEDAIPRLLEMEHMAASL
jgi:phosphoribosylformylglycinamidine synthase